ncbi:DUF3526 domain-containing protein [Phenylobacterium sp.]|uniref:DUF3526 domain-containing protein n=1 Tax=Phenylobacterium sp. TaxID=1871053 RepID=UPI00301DF036
MNGLWRREARLFLRAPGVAALLLVLLALCGLGAWNGAQRLEADRSRVAAAQSEDQAAFARKRAMLVELEAGRMQEGQFGSARKAHQAVLSAGRALAPPDAELGVLSAAEARPAPDLLKVSFLTRHRDQQPTLDDPSNRLDGPFDLSFVATWLAPLFLLFLTYDVLARDREQGSAALLASQGVSLARIVVARLGVRYLAVFAIVGGVALAAALFTEKGRPSAPALLAWLGGLALMLGVWCALSAAINARARNSAAAALALLSIWIASALLAPAVISVVVSAVAPPPDRLSGVLAMREIESDLNRRRAEVTAAYYAAKPQNRPVRQGDEYEHYFVTEMTPRTLAFDARFAPVAARMDAARVRQAEALRWASPASPSLALKLLTEDLAGGAPERRVRFLADVDAWQARWRAHFEPKLASMRPLTLADYDDKPDFMPRPEAAGARWGRIAGLLAALSIPFLLALAWAWRALRSAGPL